LGLYDDILQHLEDRGLKFVKKFIPYFLASFGCHVFNIVNMQFDEDGTPLAFYWENQRVPDMRLFIMMIAPPGYSKSTFLRHLLKEDFGVLANAGVDTFFKAYITEASLVGSVDKEGMPIRGFLERHKNAIVGVEEFSSLLTAAKQEHSLGLDTALLDWATHGEITKDLRRGEISFKTNATLWSGTQLGRERIELRGGMARRFFFILWTPSEQDEKRLVEAVLDAPQMGRMDYGELQKLRVRIQNLFERLDRLEGVYYTEDLNGYFRDHLSHNEIPLFRRLALGYNVMKGDFDVDLSVGLDDELKRLMDDAVGWRRRIYREISEETGLGTDMIVQLLGTKSPISYTDLANRLLLYEVSYSETDRYLRSLKEQKRIRVYQDQETGVVMVDLVER